jgi:hypothetical protein
VEFARWSLQLKGVPFEEHRFVPVQHIFAALAIRLPRSDHGQSKANKANKAKEGAVVADDREKRTKRPSPTLTPVCVTPDGKLLNDSWEIASYAGFEPIADASFKTLLDDKLGPLVRQLVYSYVLKPENYSMWAGLCTDGRSLLWRVVFNVGLGYVITSMMRKIFQSADTAKTEECRQRLKAVVNDLDAIISARKQATHDKFIAAGRKDGDGPGMEDIALAALMAPVLNVSPVKAVFVRQFDSSLVLCPLYYV